MIADAARESRGLPFAQASFNLFRHQIKRGDRIMSRLFRAEIFAWKFVKNSRFELMRRWIGADFVQMHACPHSTRCILADASNLLIDRLAQFVGKFDSICANKDVHRLFLPRVDFQLFGRAMIER